MSQAIIFNSALRGSEETATYRCFSTFHSGDQSNKLKASFGQLIFLNDISLSPLESIAYTAKADSQIVLLPIAGSLVYSPDSEQECFVQPEQLKTLDVAKGFSYTVHNPFGKEWINYLHIGFKKDASGSKPLSLLQNIAFNKMNELVHLCTIGEAQQETAGYIGIYEGRSEGTYALKNPDHGVFIYIIKGAFEVNGRLLELGDGLSLWNTQEIEFEALSNHATILLLEIQLD
jgi:hypothetical protein